MKIRMNQLAFAVVVAGLTTAWSAAGTGQAAPSPDQIVASLKQNLAESQKRLRQYEWIETTAISLKGEEKSRKQQRVYYGADGKLTATTDCNRVGGTYTAAERRLTFSGFFSTRMFCEGAQEGAFTRLLEQTTGYRFTPRGELVLDLDSGNGSAVFR